MESKVGWAPSLIGDCILHDVDTYTHLVELLRLVDTDPLERVVELTLRLWKERLGDDPRESMLDRESTLFGDTRTADSARFCDLVAHRSGAEHH